MNTRTAFSRVVDRVFFVAFAFFVFFLWFYSRLSNMLYALLFAIPMAMAIEYARRRFPALSTVKKQLAQQKAAAHALYMLPPPQALSLFAGAMATQWDIQDLRLEGQVALGEYKGEQIALVLCQIGSDTPLTLDALKAADALRVGRRALLYATGGTTNDAKAAIAQLKPQLLLLERLPASLVSQLASVQQEKKPRQKLGQALKGLLKKERAPRLMLVACAMLLGYILWPSFALLIPALCLICLALFSRIQDKSMADLFTQE